MVANLQAQVTLHEKVRIYLHIALCVCVCVLIIWVNRLQTIGDLKKVGVPRASDGAEALLEMALADNEKLNKELAYDFLCY